MGNTIMAPCFRSQDSVKVIFYGGATRILTGKHLAGEIMFEFPDHMVCHADSFFIGRPIPVLSIDDKLVAGQTYFLLPLDSFQQEILSASSLAALGSAGVQDGKMNKHCPVKFKECPFEYLKGLNGKVLIKVAPAFIIRLITRGGDDAESTASENSSGFLCSTPELQKHYIQLVGSKDHTWSPALETITEQKTRFSPCRFINYKV